MHTCVHAHMHTCVHAHMHTCVYASLAEQEASLHAYMRTCTHAYMRTCIHAYMRICLVGRAGGLIRPHHGVTCGQLKLHLGLAVPQRKKGGGKKGGGKAAGRRKQPRGQRCATLRVANESRGWVEGELTVFDDSYEHEVRNDCSADRVVFQMVLAEEGLSAMVEGA